MKILSMEVSGFKNISDNEEVVYNFFQNTLIEGDNYTGKTSICEAIVWGFCGCNLDGHIVYSKLLKNKNSEKMSVKIYFSDNNGVKHVLYRALIKGNIITLDDKKTTQVGIDSFIKSKDVFMSVFVPGYFSKFSSTEARNLILNIIPDFDINQILDQLSEEEKIHIDKESFSKLMKIISKKRKEIRELDKLEISLKGELNGIENSILNVNSEIIIEDTKSLENKIKELEFKLESKLDEKQNGKNLEVLIKERELLRKEYEFYKLELEKNSFKVGEKCNVCMRELDEKTVKNISVNNYKNNDIKIKIDSIVTKGKSLKKQIENFTNDSDIVDNKSNIKDLKEELDYLKEKLNQSNVLKAKNEANKKIYENSMVLKEKTKLRLRETALKKQGIQQSLDAFIHANTIRADILFQNLESNLNRVSIKLEDVNKSTGEIKECFEIKYDNKEIRLLSNSEKIRAYMEISSLINSYTGCKIPIFIDNAESITKYDKPEVQIFEAKVEKSKLEIDIKPMKE